MTGGDIAIIGLPSPGRRRLADGLGIRYLEEDARIRRPGSGAEAPRELAPQWFARLWAGYFANDNTSGALLVYRAPWDFLEDELREAAGALLAEVGRESFCAAALDFWRAYHLALLDLRHERAAQILMINGDRPIDVNGVASLVGARFGGRPASAPAAAGDGPGAAADRHEAVFREAVDVLAPECLELYATLEACAEPMGRAPENESGGLACRNHLLADALALVEKLDATSARTVLLESENALYLLQIGQIQQELERQFEHNREQGDRRVELQQRLEFESAPLWRKLSRSACSYWKPAAAFLASLARGRELRRQVRAIRLSGLFDEAWYLGAYPDVVQARHDPIEHYLKFGVSEARDPGPGFDTQWYLEAYPDVAAEGVNPLLHYVAFGRKEGRAPRKDAQPGRSDGAGARAPKNRQAVPHGRQPA